MALRGMASMKRTARGHLYVDGRASHAPSPPPWGGRVGWGVYFNRERSTLPMALRAIASMKRTARGHLYVDRRDSHPFPSPLEGGGQGGGSISTASGPPCPWRCAESRR